MVVNDTPDSARKKNAATGDTKAINGGREQGCRKYRDEKEIDCKGTTSVAPGTVRIESGV